VITVSNKFDDYAKKVVSEMNEAGLRAELDIRAESVSKKVREAQLDQINYILVVGEKEVTDGTVNVRTRANEVLGEKKTNEFVAQLCEDVRRLQ
jgi:threonyl-tRNA synthetase